MDSIDRRIEEEAGGGRQTADAICYSEIAVASKHLTVAHLFSSAISGGGSIGFFMRREAKAGQDNPGSGVPCVALTKQVTLFTVKLNWESQPLYPVVHH